MEEKQHLFSYGTLRDSSVQRIIFGNTVPMRPAVLNGWSLHKGEDGYLFIKPESGKKVFGMILNISAKKCWQLLTAGRRMFGFTPAVTA